MEEKKCPECEKGKLEEKTRSIYVGPNIGLNIAVFHIPIGVFRRRQEEKYLECNKCEYKEKYHK